MRVLAMLSLMEHYHRLHVWHEPPYADPHAGWCGRGAVSSADRPYAEVARLSEANGCLLVSVWRQQWLRRQALIDADGSGCAAGTWQ